MTKDLFQMMMDRISFRLPKLPKHLEHRKAVCQDHGEYIGVFLVSKNTEVGGCPICADREFVQNEHAKLVENRFRWAKIPELYADSCFADYQTNTKDQEKSLRLAQAYVENYSSNPARSLIFSGTTGTGKTHLAIAIVKSLLNRGLECRYTTLGNALTAIKETYASESTRHESEVLNDYIRPDVLVLDEIGIVSLSKADDMLLYKIIDGRYIKKKGTIVISNLSTDELKNFMGDRISDRLRSNDIRVIKMDFESYRK